jgi:hypothetical protein
MTANTTYTVSLTDLDAMLPEEFEILQPPQANVDAFHAIRAIRHVTTGQTYTFQTAWQYLHFVLSVTPRRLLTDVSHTRYIELSSQYDSDPFFHASVTYTVAAITRNLVVLHRMKSDETSVRFELSRAELTALVSGYQSYQDDAEQEETAGEMTRDPFLDFPDDFA